MSASPEMVEPSRVCSEGLPPAPSCRSALSVDGGARISLSHNAEFLEGIHSRHAAFKRISHFILTGHFLQRQTKHLLFSLLRYDTNPINVAKHDDDGLPVRSGKDRPLRMARTKHGLMSQSFSFQAMMLSISPQRAPVCNCA